MLTHVQKRAYDFIEKRLLATAIPPTREELAAEMGLEHASGGQRLIKQLVDRGYLHLIPNRWRNIALVHRPPNRVRYFRFDDETKRLVEWQP